MIKALRLLAVCVLLTTLTGCEFLESLNKEKPVPRPIEAAKQTAPAVDMAALNASNDALHANVDPDQPVMSVPPRAGGGVIQDVSLSAPPPPAEAPRVPSPPSTSVGAGNAAGPGGAAAGGAPAVPGAPPAPEATQPVELQFVDADLRAVIELLFTQFLKRPYTLLPDFKDEKVNWVVSGDFTPSEILRMFESFLELHGVALVDRDGMFAVSSAPQKGGAQDALIGQTTGVWKLRYVDAKEVVPMARMFVAQVDRLLVLDNSNMIIATAGASELHDLDVFLGRIDVPSLQNRNILIYVPSYVSAQSLVALIQNLPKNLGNTLPENKRLLEAEVITGQARVVIVTGSPEMKKLVTKFISEVDQPGADRRQVFYYTVKNQKAEDVRATVDQLLTGIAKDGDKISVIAHVPTNSLLITSTPEEYYEIRKVLDRIDFAVPTVLLDAVLAEVSLNDTMAYGVEWYLKHTGNNVASDILTDLSSAAILGTPAAAIGVFSLTNNQFATLDLLATKTHLEVLSRPRVIVKNKEKATIKSVREVRIKSTTSSSNVQNNGGATELVDQFESKEVGITLEATPTIGDDGSISLALKIEDSSLGPTINDQPSFDERSVDTQLMIANGETVFIGGIIRRTGSVDIKKIPGLGDIPVINPLFKNQSTDNEASELILLITPYIYYDKFSARILSEAFTGLRPVN
jgi:general secretion pathway protein D